MQVREGVPMHAGNLLLLPAGGLVPADAPQPRGAQCHARLRAGKALTAAIPRARGTVVADGCWGDPSCSLWPTGHLLQAPVAGMGCPSRGGAALWFPAAAPELLSLPAQLCLDVLCYVQRLQEMLSSSHKGPSPMALEPVAQHVFSILCVARLCYHCYDTSTCLQRFLQDLGCSTSGPYGSQPQGWGWPGCLGRAGLLAGTACQPLTLQPRPPSKAPGATQARRDKRVVSTPLLPKSGSCLGLGLASPCIARALKGPQGPSGLMEVLPT